MSINFGRIKSLVKKSVAKKEEIQQSDVDHSAAAGQAEAREKCSIIRELLERTPRYTVHHKPAAPEAQPNCYSSPKVLSVSVPTKAASFLPACTSLAQPSQAAAPEYIICVGPQEAPRGNVGTSVVESSVTLPQRVGTQALAIHSLSGGASGPVVQLRIPEDRWITCLAVLKVSLLTQSLKVVHYTATVFETGTLYVSQDQEPGEKKLPEFQPNCAYNVRLLHTNASRRAYNTVEFYVEGRNFPCKKPGKAVDVIEMVEQGHTFFLPESGSTRVNAIFMQMLGKNWCSACYGDLPDLVKNEEIKFFRIFHRQLPTAISLNLTFAQTSQLPASSHSETPAAAPRQLPGAASIQSQVDAPVQLLAATTSQLPISLHGQPPASLSQQETDTPLQLADAGSYCSPAGAPSQLLTAATSPTSTSLAPIPASSPAVGPAAAESAGSNSQPAASNNVMGSVESDNRYPMLEKEVSKQCAVCPGCERNCTFVVTMLAHLKHSSRCRERIPCGNVRKGFCAAVERFVSLRLGIQQKIRYVCNYSFSRISPCEEELSSLFTYCIHMDRHIRLGLLFPCYLCQQVFYTVYNFCEHGCFKKTVRRCVDVGSSPQRNPTDASTQDFYPELSSEELQLLQCTSCKKSFHYISLLVGHLSRNLTCLKRIFKPGTTLDLASLHLESIRNRRMFCDICRLKLKGPVGYAMHRDHHTLQQSCLECKVCSRHFFTPCSFLRHSCKTVEIRHCIFCNSVAVEEKKLASTVQGPSLASGNQTLGQPILIDLTSSGETVTTGNPLPLPTVPSDSETVERSHPDDQSLYELVSSLDSTEGLAEDTTIPLCLVDLTSSASSALSADIEQPVGHESIPSVGVPTVALEAALPPTGVRGAESVPPATSPANEESLACCMCGRRSETDGPSTADGAGVLCSLCGKIVPVQTSVHMSTPVKARCRDEGLKRKFTKDNESMGPPVVRPLAPKITRYDIERLFSDDDEDDDYDDEDVAVVAINETAASHMIESSPPSPVPAENLSERRPTQMNPAVAALVEKVRAVLSSSSSSSDSSDSGEEIVGGHGKNWLAVVPGKVAANSASGWAGAAPSGADISLGRGVSEDELIGSYICLDCQPPLLIKGKPLELLRHCNELPNHTHVRPLSYFDKCSIRVRDIGKTEEYRELVQNLAAQLASSSIKLKITRGPGGRKVVLD